MRKILSVIAICVLLFAYAQNHQSKEKMRMKKMKTSENIRGFTREIWELPEIDISGMRLVEIALEDARKDSERHGLYKDGIFKVYMAEKGDTVELYVYKSDTTKLHNPEKYIGYGMTGDRYFLLSIYPSAEKYVRFTGGKRDFAFTDFLTVDGSSEWTYRIIDNKVERIHHVYEW